jgi:hypothetical protein
VFSTVFDFTIFLLLHEAQNAIEIAVKTMQVVDLRFFIGLLVCLTLGS